MDELLELRVLVPALPVGHVEDGLWGDHGHAMAVVRDCALDAPLHVRLHVLLLQLLRSKGVVMAQQMGHSESRHAMEEILRAFGIAVANLLYVALLIEVDDVFRVALNLELLPLQRVALPAHGRGILAVRNTKGRAAA